jgi:biopolymer transport protein ExbB
MDFILPDLMTRGGWSMYAIAVCSVAALGFFLERLLRLRRGRVAPVRFVRRVRELLAKGKQSEALHYCQTTDKPIARVFRAALTLSGSPRGAIKEVVEEVGRQEAEGLLKFLPVLATVASITPLLGLLGTVSGMIKTFNVISYYGVGNPGTLAAGISEALLTTAAGLTVAIPTLVAYRFLTAKADGLISEMEKQSLGLVEMIKGD